MPKIPRLREWRERATLSQEELKDRSGVSRATIADLEAGNRGAQPRTVRRLAAALGVEPPDLYEEPHSPKAEAPSSQGKLFDNGILEEERRTAEAEVIADYERLTREYRISWRDALNALAAPWEDRLESGAFDRSMVEQFFTDVAAVSSSVSRALRATIKEDSTLPLKYKQATTPEHIEEMWATAISPAGARLIGISDRVLAAAVERFPSDELASVRSKHDEVRQALRAAA
jgi:transcriptional regulator with XRE-family HTH domain